MVDLTDDERANGWTEETLATYLKERDKAQTQTVLYRAPEKPRWANSHYDPMKFGRCLAR